MSIKTLKIFGHTYKVIEDEAWVDEESVAKIYLHELIIRINKKSPDSALSKKPYSMR